MCATQHYLIAAQQAAVIENLDVRRETMREHLKSALKACKAQGFNSKLYGKILTALKHTAKI